ncbi:MAG: sigma 54-interacting transcriptional regulator [Myxococcota bacterium]
MDAPQLEVVLASLGFFALRPAGPNQLVPEGDLPDWMQPFLATGGHLDLDAFPVLEHFLKDAEQWWQSPSGDELRSGPWSQGVVKGRTRHLEARATWLDGSARLLLRELGEDFELSQRLLQAQRHARLVEREASRERERRDVAIHCILHDLRSPIAAIKGALGLVAEQHVDDNIRPVLAAANQALARQEGLVDEVFTIYESEYGNDPNESGSVGVPVAETIRSVTLEMEPAFVAQGVKLALDLDTELSDQSVVGNSSQFQRVLLNLLQHALRSVPRGETVTVGSRLRGGMVSVWVDEPGADIPDADAASVFDRFRQNKDRGHVDHGLGLYFCRVIIERWGGMIGHTPAEPSGTRFWLALPVNDKRELDSGHEKTLNIATAFQGMVGTGPGMLELRRRIGLASQTDVTVLLTGESGTGKELAARALHDLSDRREGPFVAVNCGALSDTLLESELFGHVKGAFTGAVRDKKGMLQLADGGTLFLDEVEAASPVFQTRLLRALQEGEVRRVGDERVIKVDTRIVAASNRDLKRMMSDEEIREDFYYRLSVYEILLPPLRRRVEDIPLLVEEFANELSKRHKRSFKAVAPEAVARLSAFDWPGNIRQLRNTIEHAIVSLEGDVIDVRHLPEEVAKSQCVRLSPEDERSRIVAALTRSGGNRSEAARFLGYSRVTLWKKMKKFEIADAETGTDQR